MNTFKLNSADIDFRDRQKKVFDQLQSLEDSRKNIPDNNYQERQVNKKGSKAQRSETKHFRGKESIFKKPQNPAPKKNFINRIPDFKKNPHKWTRYSLEDVQDITEESNKKSAMDFLKELANRRKLEQGLMEEEILEELPAKIAFNRHVKRQHTETAVKEEAKSIQNAGEFSSSKVIMPEYVIGQKPAKKVTKRHVKNDQAGKGNEVKLDHLTFEDE